MSISASRSRCIQRPDQLNPLFSRCSCWFLSTTAAGFFFACFTRPCLSIWFVRMLRQRSLSRRLFYLIFMDTVRGRPQSDKVLCDVFDPFRGAVLLTSIFVKAPAPTSVAILRMATLLSVKSTCVILASSSSSCSSPPSSSSSSPSSSPLSLHSSSFSSPSSSESSSKPPWRNLRPGAYRHGLGPVFPSCTKLDQCPQVRGKPRLV
jgi:hypothetical protein